MTIRWPGAAVARCGGGPVVWLRDDARPPDGAAVRPFGCPASAFWGVSGPTMALRCAAGNFDRPRQATARDGAENKRKVEGRASGVTCRACWAAS